MTINLSKNVKEFQVTKQNFINILESFHSKIKFLSLKLKYPEAETDLIICLYEILSDINLAKFNNDLELKNYINKCLKNKSIYLYKKIIKQYENIILTPEYELLNTEKIYDNFSDINFYDLISKLNHKQKQIIYYKFYLQLSDIEIAKIFNVSRQAICKAKQKALKKLKMELSTL